MHRIGTMKTLSSKDVKSSMVSIGFECLDRELFDPARCYDLLGASGVKHARVQTGWSKCEKEKGVYDFGWLDGIVDSLLARGVQPWFNVGFGNPLYMENLPNPTGVGCVPLYYGGEAVAAWARFACALAEHYRDRVTEYEIWNESDIAHFWVPGEPDGARYAELIALTGAQIRRAQPDARIGACTSSAEETDFAYLDKLAAGLRPGELDFFCLHRYTVFPEKGWAGRVEATRAVFERHGRRLSYWMGEGGYPSWFPKGHWMHPRPDNPGSERQQAVYQLRRYFQDAALGLERSSFFQMVDMWQKPYQKASEVLSRPAAQGVLNGITYTPKRAYDTLGRLANLLSGDIAPLRVYAECSLTDTTRCEAVSIQTFALRRGEQMLFACYLPTDIQDECGMREGFSLRVYPLDAGVAPMAEPVLADLFTGEVFSAGIAMQDGCLRAQGLPIAAYPLVLCDRSMLQMI